MTDAERKLLNLMAEHNRPLADPRNDHSCSCDVVLRAVAAWLRSSDGWMAMHEPDLAWLADKLAAELERIGVQHDR